MQKTKTQKQKILKIAGINTILMPWVSNSAFESCVTKSTDCELSEKQQNESRAQGRISL